eukprot:743141-Rhodomonas_salina.2
MFLSAKSVLCHVRYYATTSSLSSYQPLRVSSSYAMPDTEMVEAAICLRACYALPDTDLAYATMRCPVCCYALSSTDMAYAGTRDRLVPSKRCPSRA